MYTSKVIGNIKILLWRRCPPAGGRRMLCSLQAQKLHNIPLISHKCSIGLPSKGDLFLLCYLERMWEIWKSALKQSLDFSVGKLLRNDKVFSDLELWWQEQSHYIRSWNKVQDDPAKYFGLIFCPVGTGYQDKSKPYSFTFARLLAGLKSMLVYARV